MASPPEDSKRRSVRKTIRHGFGRFTHAILPSSRSPSRSSGILAPATVDTRPVSPTPSATASRLNTTQPVPPQETTATGQSTAPSTLGEEAGTSPALPSVHIEPPSSGPTAIDKIRDAGSVALSGMEAALRILEKSADAFPPLKLAVGGLVDCLDIVQTAATNAEEYEALTLDLTTMAGTLNQYLSDLGSGDSGGSAARIALSIQVEIAHIKKQRAHSKGRRVLESAEEKEDVIKRYRRIEGLFRQLQGDMVLRIWRNTNEQYVTTLLRGMSPVDDARYNSSYSTTIKRRACTAETREKVQADLQDWVRDPDAAKIYWMNGMAGTGKTTIAYSLCKWLEENQRLGASFFCSRVSSSCRNVNSIVPTIAYQLARYSPAFQSVLCQVLKADPDASKLNVVQQFNKLMREPMSADKNAMPDGVVIVIDALDECEDSYGVRLVLGTLLKLGASLPVKFFVTSRPEPAIRDNMLSAGGYSPAVLHLHDIEQSIVEEDIKKYLVEELSSMAPSPSNKQIEQLAKRAGKLFIYAATAVRYILSDQGAANPASRLKAMLTTVPQSSNKGRSSNKHKQLDELYATILGAAFNGEDDETEALRLVLWTTVCAKEPMTIPTLASFLDLTEEQTVFALRPLRSVLHVSENSGLVSTLHASFPDYMLDPLRSKDFHCDQAQHSEFLAHRCFDVMKEQLRFNICSLESSFVFDKDVPGLEERIKTHISPTLFYTCRYWGEHLRLTGVSAKLCDELADFLSHRLLFWMEVLNLKLCVVKGIPILVQTESWLSKVKGPANIQKQASDARDFVTRFAGGACGRSTPHIYLSALPFCTRSSSVYAHYWERTRGLMNVRGTAINQRDKAPQATWVTGSTVLSVAFSPNGARIVSGSDDYRIQVRDAYTGDILAGPFKGHTDSVNSVVFSPNGTIIASGSNDRTIRVWDALTGDTVAGPFQGHIHSINSVAFSPDGTHIASGSSDETIRVWDIRTGDTTPGPFQLEGHTGSVKSVAFSPNGARIASGSYDKTIRVWDAHSGGIAVGPLQGHTDAINSVAFSPDGARIVSGSDDRTIRVWDADNGDIVAGPFEGHTRSVNSAIFSPNNTHIVSCSDDYTIRVWNAHTFNDVVSLFKGHSNWVKSIAISPDGTRIVSGSHDDTIRVWDARISESVTESLGGHTHYVRSIALSSDSTHIVSGSSDETIRVWDAHTGDTVAGPFQGHTGVVNSVAFSPDGTRIVSGSSDESVRVWDIHTGDAAASPFQGHTSAVFSVTFSPDGARIASGSYDKTIRVWDAHSGDTVVGPFQGHTGSISSIAFSPDGSRIVSGSQDQTIRVWDSYTGDISTGPFEGHTALVKSVAFSPDGIRVVSGSYDQTIRVWNAHTGKTIAGPFQGHTAPVNSVAFSPDGTHIVSGSCDWTFRIWDIHTGGTVAGPFKGHTDWVNSVAFFPDGALVVTGSNDETIRVWNVHTHTVVADPFQGDTNAANSAEYSFDNPYIVSNTSDDQGVLHITPSTLTAMALHSHIQNTFIGQRDFAVNDDGWVTINSAPLFWVPPDLRGHVPSTRNTFVIGPQGSISIDYQAVTLGERWSECYIP